ncbi:AraC family transcriptional regulator [Natronospirillum operosum]|uniref:AraC family transcriptional regulator n=1 Tax=Natronospirillum operosum TaxID=2759953 RepID=A0A4Z0WF89_9GAMM|nr:helix-turn-helix domain-containing protein [Natronospirillum operosum]TGG95680.1 AraC family transcriptional regulator [Natronospirillum operosum]
MKLRKEQVPSLHAYNRVLDATPMEWLGALDHFAPAGLTPLPVSQCATMTGLSHLAVRSGSIASLRGLSSQPIRIACTDDHPLLIIFCRNAEPGHPQSTEIHTATPDAAIEVRCHAGSELVIVQFQANFLASGTCLELDDERRESLDALLTGYLHDADFFPRHRTAVAVTVQLLQALQQVLLQQQPRNSTVRPARARSDHDSRVMRVVNFMRTNPDWSYNVGDLAALAHTSERNLYKLMALTLDQTPYQLYRRLRLLLARDALLRCDPFETVISRHAVDHGFLHLGRFSAQYREHFGELPSQTLTRRKRLIRRGSMLLKQASNAARHPSD